MPWNITRRGDRFCVVKSDTEKIVGCHDTRDKAEGQMRALYASETETAALEVLDDDASPMAVEEDVAEEEFSRSEIPSRVGEATPQEMAAEMMGSEEEEEEWDGYALGRPLTAAGPIPVKPPKGWFEHVEPVTPGPATISADGRYSGYLALKDTPHIGYDGKRVTVPMGEDYRYFHLGSVETEEGEMVATGHITFDTGHADLDKGARSAAAHYDNTGTVGADVRVGEDKHGVWVEGALRSDLGDEQVRALRAAPLSGDWRRIGDRLRLVAALAVNVPGFSVPFSMAASGDAIIVTDSSLNDARKKALVNTMRKKLLTERVG